MRTTLNRVMFSMYLIFHKLSNVILKDYFKEVNSLYPLFLPYRCFRWRCFIKKIIYAYKISFFWKFTRMQFLFLRAFKTCRETKLCNFLLTGWRLHLKVSNVCYFDVNFIWNIFWFMGFWFSKSKNELCTSTAMT